MERNGQSHPLFSSLLIGGSTLVVIGYGGWDDVVTQALMETVLDDRSYPDILWTLRDTEPRLHDQLASRLSPGIDRGRVTFYGGVDCNDFLPGLAEIWAAGAGDPGVKISTKSAIPIHFVSSTTDQAQQPEPPTISFSRGEQDHPPKTEFYVGRADELSRLVESTASVVYLTGIGGAGKSALAAHYFAHEQIRRNFDYHVWRDCKEESERFERQLISIVASLSGGKIGIYDIATQPIEALTELFITLIVNIKILIIFDNIDHYVDLERGLLTGSAARFCDRFLQHESSCKILFTCRPTITQDHQSVLSFRLEGITSEDAIELFKLRNAPADEASVRQAHALTRGHAYWLDLLAAQVARRSPQIGLTDLLRSFDTDTPELPIATLRSIWSTLREREQLVLQSLAETVRPTPMLQLADYLASRLRYNQLHRTVKSLRSLSLLIVKPQEGGQEVIELHPLVRTFVRTTFAQPERVRFIHSILDVYKVLFGLHQSDKVKASAEAMLDYWMEGAELHISAGEFADAVACLQEISATVENRSSPNEFVRVSRLLFDSADWGTLKEVPGADQVFKVYIDLQSLAGRVEECIKALDIYAANLDGKEARYILYCDLRCHMHWINGDNLTAIKWGAEGVKLKEDSGTDTKFDSAHNLALARRDAGIIDPALKFFLKGRKLQDVIADSQANASFGGTAYGNVGRCLHLMGQLDPALACYRNSAAIIEPSTTALYSNKAYFRQWIGEVLVSKGEFVVGLLFLEAAKSKWQALSPPKAEKVARVIRDVVGDQPYDPPAGTIAENAVARWLKGEPAVEQHS